MEKTFDAAMLAIREIAKLYPNQEDATRAITMAVIAYRMTFYEGIPSEIAKKIVFRVESTQEYSHAALSLEERVYSFLDLITVRDADMDVEARLERLFALDDEALAANIDEMACTIMSQVVEDFDGGC